MPRTPFDNASIKAPLHNKPHICKRDGWWRVSKMTPFRAYRGRAWQDAHLFVNRVNVDERIEHTKRKKAQ